MLRLHDYQVATIDWLLPRPRAYLALDPGLGKTTITLAEAQMRKAARVQVVAPASVVSHWQQHATVWAPDVDVRVTSWDKARRGDMLSPAETDVLILDESHFAKSLDAKRTRVVLRHAAQCKVVRCNSATPVPNGAAAELFPVLKALFPEVLRAAGVESWNDYVAKFCHRVPVPGHHWKTRVIGTRNAEILRPLLAPHFYRRRVSDVFTDLPPLRLDVVTLDSDIAPEFYDFDLDSMSLGLQAETRKALGQAKVVPIANILRDELARNEIDSVVLFAHHLDVIAQLHAALEPFGICGFTGDASQRERQKVIDTFNTDDAYRVFIGQMTAAGTGTNLHKAREVVILEPSWVPGENIQAIRRVYRPAAGVKGSVRARIFAVAGTQDERLMRSLAKKTRDMESLGIREVA